MKLTFPEGNDIPYMQDMQFWRGMPTGVEFDVEPHGAGKLKLRADGYGARYWDGEEGRYGNGAIFISEKDLPVTREDVEVVE